jgi:endonuclease YncB( thermonuclease family)
LAIAALPARAGAQAADPPAAKPCTLTPGPSHTVVRVIDAETVRLDDGGEVRLIGALAPRAPDFADTSAPWPPEQQAVAQLTGLVLGRSVELAFAEHRFDRYGRLLAHLFVMRDAERVWVQGKMLSSGNARAYVLPGDAACLPELVAHEAAARAAGSGIWALSLYRPRSADDPAKLLKRRNSFEIVTGRIAHVAPSKTRTYLNFGEDWHTDFTAGIAGKVLRARPEWAQTLGALEGRTVEVRGWIEYRNGPYIEITDPGQLVPVEEGAPSAAAPAPKGPAPQGPSPKGPSMSSGKPLPPAGLPATGGDGTVPNEQRPEQAPGAVNL